MTHSLVYLTAALTLAGCAGDSAQQSRGFGSQIAEEYESEETGPSQSQLDEIESAQSDVRLALDDVQYQISRFSDGSTNWQFVVSDAESSLDDLDYYIMLLDNAVSDAGVESDVDVWALRSEADWLRSQVDRFRSQDRWSDVVPDVESEAYGLDNSLYDVESDIEDLEAYEDW